LRHAVHIASWGFGVHILDSPKCFCKLGGIHILQLHLASGAIIPPSHWLDHTQLWTYISNVLVFHVNLKVNWNFGWWGKFAFHEPSQPPPKIHLAHNL
jgi:hypothetical protein